MTDPQIEMMTAAVSAACEQEQSDLILFNSGMEPRVSDLLRAQLESRGSMRPKATIILVSAGGLADEAYRCARLLQSAYSHICVCVPGWCKSAGTLFAIGAHELIIGTRGELGPLDVQITKRDELFDRDSGLISNAALDRLRAESFEFFEQFMLQIIARSQQAVTFRTAADIAAEVTVGALAPIYEKLDPLRLGADSRAMEIGSAYAQRLNMVSDNLKGTEQLNMLLNGYPAHSFVIDGKEASEIFTRVKPLTGDLLNVINMLGLHAIAPSEEPLIGYLEGADDEDGTAEKPDAGTNSENSGAAEPASSEPKHATEVLRAALQRNSGSSGKGRRKRSGVAGSQAS